jgi:hypothetical protein
MTTTGHRRLVAALAVTVGLLTLAVGWLIWSLGVLRLRVAFAEDQTAIFEEMREKAQRAGPKEAAECLAYVVHYYASGSKQETGSRLDQIVERARARAIADIIAHLRAKTGEDLGSQPEPWVRKYAPESLPRWPTRSGASGRP